MRRRPVDHVKVTLAVVAVVGVITSGVQCRDSRAERAERAAERAEDRADLAAARAELAAAKARQLDVSLSFVAPVAKGMQFPMGLNFRAVNPGHQIHTVTVAAAGLILPDGSPLWFGRGIGDWQFPKRIVPGENAGVHFAGKDLAQLCDALETRGFSGTGALIGFCEDGENRLHRSAPLQFNIDEALALAKEGES